MFYPFNTFLTDCSQDRCCCALSVHTVSLALRSLTTCCHSLLLWRTLCLIAPRSKNPLPLTPTHPSPTATSPEWFIPLFLKLETRDSSYTPKFEFLFYNSHAKGIVDMFSILSPHNSPSVALSYRVTGVSLDQGQAAMCCRRSRQCGIPPNMHCLNLFSHL